MSHKFYGTVFLSLPDRIWNVSHTRFPLNDAILLTATQTRNRFFRLLFRGGQVLNWTNAWLLPLFSSATDFPTSCRLIQNVFAGQMCPRARLCLCVNLPTFSPRMARDTMVVSGIKWTSGPFLSDAGWWAKLKVPRISKLATPSWCAAFMAPEKQSEKMRLTWSVEGMQCFVLFCFLKNSVTLQHKWP